METSQIIVLGQFIGAIVVITLVSKLFGLLFKLLKQPEVMGEVVGGIFLGPSFVGTFFPGFSQSLFTPEALNYVNIFANFGIVIYMFVVGLELNIDELKKSLNTTFGISLASVIIPFIIGIFFSSYLFSYMGANHISKTDFSFFIGISMAITAFPVLARILSDLKLTKSPLGSLALACAAINDVIAWALLALLVSRVNIENYSMSKSVWSVYLLTAVYLILVFTLLKKKISAYVNLHPTYFRIILFFLLALVSSMITNFIGIHSIFGAFVIGAIIPFDSKIAHKIEGDYKKYIQWFFLPAFFANTGMKTQLNLIVESNSWPTCLLIIAVAIIGKLGGTMLISKLFKKSWHESFILGILMNARGLVELIVLNIGYELNIISDELFTMLVIMALVTTFLTGPLLHLFYRQNN